MTGYEVWYRHDAEQNIHFIPVNPATKSLTLQQLREATQGLHITHMFIRGDIPPGLESIAADVQKLKVENLRDDDQLAK